ncbi:MAG: bifunctional D-glycero-beta-D-manno-heptose-7-phosphate kinase/D-glycero-beta-D-manno-heptose 1-phosphate adenylyltransferase HldE [Gammaproteobacteria bacterium]|nr:bifunctional D-glycero-beta-D-manno-heptose-7-phosphate kinase/D-glycero-beta-D-manno-heptose 1-phosphate adenylyltransferase HldE [Gammaproteobacteria bacterium]
MKIHIPDFSQTRVLVIGDVMLDRYWYGPTSRISPEAPVPIVKVDRIEDRPGGAANVALNIASLLGQTTVLGWVGADESAQILRTQLEQRAVQCQLLTTAQHATITKLRIVSRQQQLIRMDFEDGFANAEYANLVHAYDEALSQCDAVILSDYGKGTLLDVADLIARARAAGKAVLIDPKGTDFSRYKNASVITPNQSEFEAVVGVCVDEATLIQKAEQLRQSLNLDALLITRSEKGMALFRKNQQPLLLPTHAREVFDVTGAGDTVIAVLAAGIAAKMEWADATALSNLAAGVVVAKLGTATANLRELQLAMLAHEPLQRGVVQEDALLALLARARASGERIVMTNGCFDILHAGHVAYLAQARALGDRLIVAVNSDESVKRLKGPQRPVNAVAQRMIVLSALESVDWVVPFSEDTPARIIEKLQPDVLVKGGDYKVEQIAGAESVHARGGDVIVLGFIDGCSTSGIIESIQKSM